MSSTNPSSLQSIVVFLSLSLAPGSVVAQDRVLTPADDAESWEYRIGVQAGASFSSLHGQNTEGMGFTVNFDNRFYSPSGFGLVLRPRLELGSPNLVGGDLGPAFQATIARLSPNVALSVGGALGVSAAARFNVSLSLSGLGGGLGPGGGGGSETHVVGGYFGELNLELLLSRRHRQFYLGLAVVHHGMLFDTHPENRSPIFSISPRLTFGGRFVL